MKHSLLIASCAFVLALAAPTSSNANAQAAPTSTRVVADSVSRAIERAVSAAELEPLHEALALAERASAAYPSDALLAYYNAYALYRTAVATYGVEGSGKARPYVERAVSLLEKLTSDPSSPVAAENEALLSAVYGVQIATSRIQAIAGMRFGPKSTDRIERAIKQAPLDPRVWLLRGIGAFNAPKAFGGGLERAEEYLKKSIELFASDTAQAPWPHWGKAEAHVWLGRTYAGQRRIEEARSEYMTALAIDPDNRWVRLTLLPKLGQAPQ